MKRKFIINTFSGTKMSKGTFESIKEFSQENFKEFDHFLTENRDGIIKKTRQFLHEGYEQLIVCGGDGTLNAVVNGYFENGQAINPEASLVVTKVGCGSDYYKVIYKGKKKTDWKEVVLNHNKKKVDVGYMEFLSEKFENMYFANIISCGNSPYISEQKNNLPKWIPKMFQYMLPTLASIKDFKDYEIRLVVDGTEYELDIFDIIIAKGQYFGGGMLVGKDAELDDGLFDITVLDKIRPIKLLPKLPSLYTGTLDKHKEIKKYKGSTLEIYSKEPMLFEEDGEVYGTTDCKISIKKLAMSVCFPI